MNLLTRQEAAKLLNISTSTLDSLKREGFIGFVQKSLCARVYFRPLDIDTYLARCSHPPRPQKHKKHT